MFALSRRDTNRREWLAAAVAAGSVGCGQNKGTGFNGYALVANAGDSSLAAIDLVTFRLVRNIGLGAAPMQVLAARQPSGTHAAYVLTPANGTVHLIDGHLNRTKSCRLADSLSQIGFSPDGTQLIALAPHTNQLIEVDLLSLEPGRKHKLTVAAESLDFSVSGYVAAASSSGALELIELATGKRTRSATSALGAIRFRGDGKVLLAGNLANRSLLALDVPSLQVVAELPLAMQPEHLCFNSDQGQLFVSGAGMDGVAVVFPYKTLEVDQTLLAGRDPGVMTCSAQPALLFVGSSTGSDVCILNINNRRVVGFVEMGGRPSFLTVTPDSQYALILDEAGGDMGVIHIPPIRATRLKTGAALYTMLSVGSRPVDIAVLPRVV